MIRNRYEILPCGRAVIYLRGAGEEHAALVSAEDLPKIGAVPGKWYAQRRSWTIYAACTIHAGGVKRTIRLHRYLLDCPDGMEVDHADHDGLNNTRENLRVVTPDENKASARPWGDGVDVDRWYESGCLESFREFLQEDYF